MLVDKELYPKEPKKKNVNTDLGLPWDKMKTFWIAFDIDGTLRDNTVDQDQAPIANEDIRTLLIILKRSFKNVKIAVWSGSGELYARQVGASFAIDDYVDIYMSKTEWQRFCPTRSVIAIDDIQNTNLGNVGNLIVKMK